jgi:hypothetical protein
MPFENSDFDTDARNSDLTIGIEVEYPGMNPGDEKFMHRGRSTNDLSDIHWPSSIGGRAVYDGTVGLEVVSDQLQLEDAANWYKDVIEYVEEEHNTRHQPVGLMSNNTAGLHIHLSSLSSSQAQELYRISETPWAKVLFCSSIAMEDDSATWPVFRGGSYCRMNYDSGSRYDCVNGRGGGHYEWRMPEPMVGEHMEILVKFLRLFEQSPDAAREYAQEVLDDADDRITSVRRAEAVGMDIDSVPTVERSPYSENPEAAEFYEAVEERWTAPEIYRINHDDGTYYIFESRLEGEFEVAGVTFTDRDILRADTLEAIEDAERRDDIRRAYNRHGNDEIRETEATNELKKIVKKKKGKSVEGN